MHNITGDRAVVRLGTHGSRFAIAQTGLRVLGSIQNGLEIGALAQLPDGTYLQVNGDIHRMLPTACIEAAIARAKARRSSMDSDGLAHSHSAVVVYKPRRRISQDSQQSA